MNSTDLDYPRMLFHRREGAVTVYSGDEEQALGPGWSRTILAQQPAPPKPEEDEEDDDEPEPEKKEAPVPAEPKRAVKRYANR